MAKKLILRSDQFKKILSENDESILGHPIAGSGGDEYNPQTMAQHKRTFRSFNENDKKFNKGNVTVDYDTFKEEVKSFIKQLLDKPMEHSLPPFWRKVGIDETELLNEMAEVGLISWYTPNGTIKYVAFKDKFDENVQELFDNLSNEKELNEAQSPEYRDPIDPEKEYQLMHMNDEIAIFKKGKKGFVFYHESVSKDDYQPYAEVPLTPTGGKDEEGFKDYDVGDFEVDGEVVSRYVNDNLNEFSFGYGLEGWSNSDNMVLITNKLKDELLNLYGDNDPKLREVLEGTSLTNEVTGAAGSSGSFETKLGGGDAMVRRPSYNNYAPHSQIKESEEEKVKEPEEEIGKSEEKGTVEYEKDMAGEEPFTFNGKKFKYVWVKDEDGNSAIGVYCFDTDTTHSFNDFYQNYVNSMNEVTGAAGSSGAYVQPKIWADNPKNMTHGQQPFFKGGQIVQNPMNMNEQDQHNTPLYPGGGFVEFDDCVRFNNNKEAEKGGCSQGAVDNVVKVKKGNSKKGIVQSENEEIYNEVAKRTGRSIDEVKDIIKRKAEN